MMRLRATQEVHIRSGAATRTSANKKGVVFPGFDVDVANKITGESIEGNDLWYKDLNGDFYWSGGFLQASTTAYDYGNALTKIHELGITGKGQTVAVIDSGVHALDFFPNHLKRDSTQAFIDHFTGDNSMFHDFRDINGHGTSVASIISSDCEFSLAPGCNLVVCKITESANLVFSSRIIKALDWCINHDDSIKIINCSFAIPNRSEQLDTLIDDARRKNKIIVAASGLTSDSSTIEYPALYPSVISIGAVDALDNALHHTDSPQRLNFCAPGINVSGLRIDDSTASDLKGSSFSAAYFSAYAALCLDANATAGNPFPANVSTWLSDITLRHARLTDRRIMGQGIVDPLASVLNILNSTNPFI